MSEWWDEVDKPKRDEHKLIADALQYLARVCDGARELDNQGFNGVDAEFGHSLAEQSQVRRLSSKQESAALKMLRKYRGQLERGGIELFVTERVP